MKRDGRFTCEDTFRRLDAWLDRALSAEERERVQAHLRECEACAQEYRFESTFVSDVRGKLRRITAPRDLLDRITRNLEESSG